MQRNERHASSKTVYLSSTIVTGSVADTTPGTGVPGGMAAAPNAAKGFRSRSFTRTPVKVRGAKKSSETLRSVGLMAAAPHPTCGGSPHLLLDALAPQENLRVWDALDTSSLAPASSTCMST